MSPHLTPLSPTEMLLEMGIRPLWQVRGEQPATPEVAHQPVGAASRSGTESAAILAAVPSSAQLAPVGGASDEAWAQLHAEVSACRACPLCEHRNRVVVGVGDQRPRWLLIGEGPGAEEDARGEPFVGQAGRLLDNMLAAMGLVRGEGVYIANAVKCRPPGNRTPEHSEMAACRHFLERQIALLSPELIVLMGKAAVYALLHEDKSLASLRQQRFEYAGKPVVVTYHPAYLLRNLPDKVKAWEDLRFAHRCLPAVERPPLTINQTF